MLLLCGSGALVSAQSVAAEQKLAAKYDAAQLEDIQTHTHYKYVGLLLFYAESFLVEENDHPRPATEAEIQAVDLDAYNPLRQVDANVVVKDQATGLKLVLLSRDNFEQLYRAKLNDADLLAYEQYKASVLSTATKGAN
jgi:hypothetical protein